MDIYERIKLIRKTLQLSQTAFAEKLGMTMQGIQKWDAKKVEIKESSLLLIEQTYNVNPSWLRNGEGEMFIEKEKPRAKGMNSHDALILAALRHISLEEKEFIIKYIEEKRELSELRKKDKIKKAQAG